MAAQSKKTNRGGDWANSVSGVSLPSRIGTQPLLRAHCMSIPVSPTSQTVSPAPTPLGAKASRTGSNRWGLDGPGPNRFLTRLTPVLPYTEA